MSFGHYSTRFAVFACDNSSGTTPNIAGLYPGPNNVRAARETRAHMSAAPDLTVDRPLCLSQHWYTYSVGPVFFASMSTEAYFFYNGVQAQYEFLDAQLSAVDRSVFPWIVVYGPRSIYCSCDTDCDAGVLSLWN